MEKGTAKFFHFIHMFDIGNTDKRHVTLCNYDPNCKSEIHVTYRLLLRSTTFSVSIFPTSPLKYFA
jgi:hypothetical protein